MPDVKAPISTANQTKGDTGTPYALMGVLLTLYFAQGLPAGFITQALPAILREYAVSLRMIGLSGLLLVPWALKFLWAPVVDKYFSVHWGRSRSWILPLQLLSALIVASVGLFNPHQLSSPQTLWAIYTLLFLLSLIGATHDVAADGLATRSLSVIKQGMTVSPRQSMGENDDVVEVSQRIGLERKVLDNALDDKIKLASDKTLTSPYQGMGNAMQVIGYRLGLILGGGVFLLVLGSWSWRYSFFAMAALIVINTVPIWRYPENKHIPIVREPDIADVAAAEHKRSTQNKRSTVAAYLKDQYGYFWQNQQMRAWLMVLLSFKIVDGISSGMVKPMMVDMGIPTKSIGLWASVLGSIASLLGAAVAAWALKKVAHHTALVGFNVLQVMTTGLYIVVAIGFEHPSWLGLTHTVPFWWAYAANAIEHMAAALALVAMLTMVMHYTRHDKAGSDFTTQVCLLTVFSGGSHLLSGFMAEQLGYTGHFIVSVGIGVICIVPLIYWRHLFVRHRAGHNSVS